MIKSGAAEILTGSIIMQMHSRLILVSACALLAGSGCSQSLLRTTLWKPSTSATTSSSVTSAVVEAISDDRWTQNSSWSAISRSDDWRWQFVFDPQTLRTLTAESSSLPSGLTTSDEDATSDSLETTPSASVFEDQPRLPDSWYAQLPHLASRSDQVGHNATLLWSQHDPANAVHLAKRLKTWVSGESAPASPTDWWRSFGPESVELPTHSESFRAAAAEVWCRVLGEQPGDPVDNLAQVAKLLEENSELPVAVRLELWRGLSRFVPPVAIAEINKGLQSESGGRAVRPEVRQTALEACLIYATHHSDQTDWSAPLWPENLLEWADRGAHTVEDDPIMRKNLGTWLALTRHPGAIEVLKNQLNDTDTFVRQAAMENLGHLQTPEALELLQQQVQRTEPTIRAGAVRALSRWGVRAISEFIGDSSLEVRIAVAESLADFPDLQTANLLWRLQTDASRDVQRAALMAIRDWPDSLAIPLLLHGLERGSTTTRRRCYTELAARTDLTEPFPFFGTASERADAVQALASRNNLPIRLDGPMTTTPTETQSDWQRIDDLQADLKLITDPETNIRASEYQDAFERLRRAKPADIPAIEAFLAASDPSSVGVQRIEQEVLPEISPVYRTLADFQSEDLKIRRQAARELAEHGAERSLSPRVARRLGEHLAKETDELIWRSALAAIWRDSHPDIDRIIRLAAHQEVTGVRQLACEYASAHANPSHGEWLPILLTDESLAVQLAAIDAAGRCRNRRVLDGVGQADSARSGGLRPLLASSQETVRVAAAIAMSRHGDPQGLDELIRLSWHRDGRIRRQVVQAMGESGQARFIEHLIRLGWTDRDVTVRRAVLGSLEQLVPPATRPPELAKMRTTDDRLAAWQNWRFATSSAETGGTASNQHGNRPNERNP
ncbi:HEAT repeat domain-containing protein [Thalassoroseus pseudoceratinae]|uniref:HEAT repeat domain-containing protein n=1 Tax=Thalassoroseus pseudoceratinae TaxID=2713176 RepID=UPI00142420BF|nr:HEAT repeat domain-containing protein [Thalassoroseus pseudoceratinae]